MRRTSIFGSHLYSQIVYPLLAASVVVGVVATVVAVYFLQDLTDRWVSQVAQSSTESIVFRYTEYARQMERVARLAVADDRLADHAAAHDEQAMRADIIQKNTTLDFDSMMILDHTGRVVAVVGANGVSYGDTPFGDEGKVGIGRPRTIFTTIGEQNTLTTLHPITGEDDAYTLAASRVISDSFLETLGVGGGAAFCFYGPDGELVACALGEGFEPGAAMRLDEAMKAPDPAITAALADAGKQTPGMSSIKVGSSTYQVWAERLQLPGTANGNSVGHVVGLVSQDVSAEAGRTTRNLIMMWSIVAVVALVGLGGWVARRVSDPLVELSAGARRIADGDFSTKVTVEGANEISELAETFNDMTDSLHERSESLTKKVLELATLYEMSRALGSTLDMDELLHSVLQSALRIFDLDLGYVALRDKDTGSLAIRAVHGAVGAGVDGAVRSSMSEWVVREGRPLIFNPEAGVEKGRIDTVTGAKAALCVPLVSAEGTIGSITIGSSDATYRFNSDDVRLLSTIANHVTIAIGNIELFTSLQEAYLATVRSLAAAVDAKDTYTRGHSDRVATYSTLIAERMGLSHEQRIALEMAAYLHDIGKIGVREEILLKPGKLDDAEMAQMRHHPLIGANILKPVAFPWAITPVVRHHHESFDGTGYPAGLQGEEIPLLARILTVADSYEAMTADRPYRKGRSAEEALEELNKCAGTQFDARIVTTFSEVVEELIRAGERLPGDSYEEVAPEEARAIFSALVDGVFASFRRLGGPRLASNVESEVDAYLREEGLSFRIVRGRMTFTDDAPVLLDGEVDQMRTALRRMDAIMGRMSGSTLVDHFYTDAFEGFSGRMRYLARTLDFYDAG